MFMKSKTEAKASEAHKGGTPPEAAQASDDAPQHALPEKAFISKDIVIAGNVSCEGELHIDGRIKGNVRSFAIILSDEARVEGDLIGDQIAVRGAVKGNIRGAEVRLLDGCNVVGNIIHEKLSVETGALFEGQIRRTDSAEAEELLKGSAPDRSASAPTPAEAQDNNKAGDAKPAPGPAAADANAPDKAKQAKTLPKQQPQKAANAGASPVIVRDAAMIVGKESTGG